MQGSCCRQTLSPALRKPHPISLLAGCLLPFACWRARLRHVSLQHLGRRQRDHQPGCPQLPQYVTRRIIARLFTSHQVSSVRARTFLRSRLYRCFFYRWPASCASPLLGQAAASELSLAHRRCVTFAKRGASARTPSQNAAERDRTPKSHPNHLSCSSPRTATLLFIPAANLLAPYRSGPSWC